MIIYKAVNNVNGKVYIGQTIYTLQKRRIEHLSNANSHSNYSFARALNKYGEGNFYWIILNECDNIDLLNQLEQYYILYYDSMDKDIGYNLQSGGLNFLHSEKTIKKMSEKRRGKNNSFYKKKHSEESRQKMKKKRPDTSGENHWNYGKHLPEETKQKIRDNMPDIGGKNHWNYGKKASEETIKKMRIARIKYWKNKI